MPAHTVDGLPPPPNQGHILMAAFLKVVKKVDGEECTRESTSTRHLKNCGSQYRCQLKAPPANGALIWHRLFYN